MNDQIAQKIKSLYASNKLPWIIIGVGIALRLFRYLYNPSLWHDESNMGIDIISRHISDLINPSSDYNQAYPLAFLISVKLATQVLGTSEYAIRLIPILTRARRTKRGLYDDWLSGSDHS